MTTKSISYYFKIALLVQVVALIFWGYYTSLSILFNKLEVFLVIKSVNPLDKSFLFVFARTESVSDSDFSGIDRINKTGVRALPQ
jgi:hypothetical protein